MTQEIEVDELLERAGEDSTVGRFLSHALIEHCDNEEHALQFLTSLIVNMGVNKMICPVCFQAMLAAAIDEVFIVENDGDDHEVTLAHAEEIAQATKGDKPIH